MKEDVREILVQEIMSKRPRTGTPDMTVQQAARVMLLKRVGSLVVLEDDKPIGILTERDIVEKIVAENKTCSEEYVGAIMSTPLITIRPDETVGRAAEVMYQKKVRRLPVVKEEKLVGMLTENDVLRLSPALIEITREWTRIFTEGEAGQLRRAGRCDLCEAYSNNLRFVEGELLCPECVAGRS